MTGATVVIRGGIRHRTVDGGVAGWTWPLRAPPSSILSDETIEVPKGATVLEAGGCLVGPGLVDLHTHLRQPGHEEAETVEFGARAATLGGYTARAGHAQHHADHRQRLLVAP